MTESLGVSIQAKGTEVPVGVMTRNDVGQIQFEFERSYIGLGPSRPILSSGLIYLGDEDRTVAQLRSGRITRYGNDVDPWFSNLLPEGALRALVERGLPSGMTSNFDVLAHLGEDLPGAVVARPIEGYRPRKVKEPPTATAEVAGGANIRFSLAGIQLKMSMSLQKENEHITFPASGKDGDMIVKLPSERYPLLPEIEFTSMKLAEAAGVEVASCSLVPVSSVLGLDENILKSGATVLSVERFDRKADGLRVHMEDFAQVMGIHPDRKYTAANEETVLHIATRLGGGGTRPFLEGARRIACNILLGNTDAHLKNWSLLYPDPTAGRLSPAYDIVASWLYDRKESMALRFRNTRNPQIVDFARFVRAAELCGVPERAVLKAVRATVENAADTWRDLLKELPIPGEMATALIERAHSMALTKDAGASFLRREDMPNAI